MSNFVQGVQGVVQGSVQGLTPYCAWAVQGVQGFTLRDACVQKPNTPLYNKNLLAYITPPAHPAHPAQLRYFVTCICAGYFSHPAHPAHSSLLLLLKKMKEKKQTIICGPDNIKEFKQQAEERVPGFLAFAGALYKSGMIVGLRGATITPITPQKEITQAVEPQKEQIALTCGQCSAFQKDLVGDGTGIGQCAKNIKSRLPINPRTEACALIELRK